MVLSCLAKQGEKKQGNSGNAQKSLHLHDSFKIKESLQIHTRHVCAALYSCTSEVITRLL